MSKKSIHKVYCLPFAGASKYAYAQFGSLRSQSVEFIGFDLPGRGTRFTEKALTTIDEMVDDLFEQFEPLIGQEYSIFGHSMGTILAQRLCERLATAGLSLPKRLFLSGRGGPNTETTNRNWHQLPSEEFRKKVFELGGSPKEVIEHPELMDLLEPILRADFQAVETYLYPSVKKLDIPVSVFYGTNDRCSLEECEDWQAITDQDICIKAFDGDHFFIFSQAQNLVQSIVSHLEK